MHTDMIKVSYFYFIFYPLSQKVNLQNIIPCLKPHWAYLSHSLFETNYKPKSEKQCYYHIQKVERILFAVVRREVNIVVIFQKLVEKKNIERKEINRKRETRKKIHILIVFLLEKKDQNKKKREEKMTAKKLLKS